MQRYISGMLKVWSWTRPLALVLTLAALNTFANAEGAKMAEISPEPSDAILFNPGMGIYHQYPPYGLSPEHWSNEVCGIAYMRWIWSDLNPEEGVYRFDEVLGKFWQYWYKERGVPVAFRVMSQSMHSLSKYPTPKWVFDKGVPSVEHYSLKNEVQWDPVFWDDMYLAYNDKFIEALGKWLDHRPGIEFIDIGGIGEWGEMHLARWTPEQMQETGYTHYKYVMAYRKMIDSYVRHLAGYRIFLNVGGKSNHVINDYAFRKGVHFRQDGLMSEGASYKCGEWLYKEYAPKGALCNYEFYASYDSMVKKNWSLPKTIDIVLSEPISYLNSNIGIYDGKNRELIEPELRRVGKKIGYHLRPDKVSFFESIHVGAAKQIPVRSVWVNDGLAAPGDSFAIEWSLVAADGKIVAATQSFPTIPTTMWAPGTKNEFDSMIDIPENVLPGACELRVRLYLPETERNIQLACAGKDDQGRYTIAKVDLAVQTETFPQTVYKADFNGGTLESWQKALKSMDLKIAKGQGKDGSDCLCLTGAKKQNTWNYLACGKLPNSVPWGRYRMSAEVKIVRYSGPKAPYFKIAVNSLEDKWIANFTGGPYNLAAPGTWQTLSAEASCKDDPWKLQIALETNNFAGDVDEVEILIDNVRLDLVAEP